MDEAGPASIHLEIPIDSKDSRRKGFDPRLCRLTLGAADRDGDNVPLFARIISSFKPRDMDVFVEAVNPFRSVASLAAASSKRVPTADGDVVCAVGALGIEEVLRGWPAEAHVMYFASEATLGYVRSSGVKESHGKRTWRLGFEAHFSSRIPCVDPVVFFAMSHQSVEVVGTRAAVLRCFDIVRQDFLPKV
jgi:hypothetical protein